LKIFLYHIKGTPGEEGYFDRKLVCSVDLLAEEEAKYTTVIPQEDTSGFTKLKPGINCAFRYDPENGEATTYKYFKLKSFEITTTPEFSKLVLYK